MSENRQAQRKAISLLVKRQDPDVDTFVEEFATNLSRGGMFLRTRKPAPLGTRVQFAIQLAGGKRVLRGEGEVRWICEPGSDEGPPGMGLRFTKLDKQSKVLIKRMLSAKPAEPVAAPVAAAPKPAPKPAPAPAAKPAPKPAPAPAAKPAPAPVSPALDAAADFDLDAPVAPAPSPTLAEAADFDLDTPEIPAAPPAPEAAADFDLDAPEVPAAPPAPEAAAVFDLDAPEIPATPPAPEAAPDFGLDAPEVPAAPLAPEAAPDFDLDSPRPPSPMESALGAASDHVLDAEEDLPLVEAESFEPELPAEEELPLVEAESVEPEPPAVEAAVPPVPTGPRVEIALDELFSEEEEDDEDFFIGLDDEPAAAPIDTEHLQGEAPLPEGKVVASRSEAPESVLPEVDRSRPVPAGAGAPVRVDFHEPTPEVARPRASGACAFLEPPESIPETGPIIGIDLGTTNSCVAVVVAGRPTVISSLEGHNLVPSVVALTDQGKLLIGNRAKGQILTNPDATIYGAKRLVGRTFDSPVVQLVQNRFLYPICADAHGRAAVTLGEHIVSLEEVQGLILREAKTMAETYLKGDVCRAVITVPAYYSEPQRQAVRAAGRLAGLRVERIVNEPTAAALAYGLNRSMSRHILVYDLGGGTFDATVLKIENNVFEVLATAGDTFLGGADFDDALVGLLVRKFEVQNGVAFAGERIALSRINDAVERAKVALSESHNFEVKIPYLMVDAKGQPYDLDTTLSRDELEAATLGLIDRSLEVVRDVLLDAGVKAKEIETVILVGGQSRMPMIRTRLEEMLGLEAHAGVHADEAVALGASLLAASIDKVSDLVLIDVLPMTIGFGLPGGGFKRVIERNTQLPCQQTVVVPTTRDHQEKLELSLFQGEDENVVANEYLGTIEMSDLPRGKKGEVKVMVTLRLDGESVLHAEARELTTKKMVTADLATRYSPAEIQKKLGVDAAAAEQALGHLTEQHEPEEKRGIFGRLFGRKKKKD